MGIKHDLTLLDITILLEETSNLLLRQTRMDASDEEVGAWVDSAIILRSTTITLGRTTKMLEYVEQKRSSCIPRLSVTIASRGGRATRSTSRAVVATGWARRCAAITFITGSLVCASS
jgi:hypothetical protein